MTGTRELPRGGLVRGRLPRGCALCEKGAKMVLLVTGRCGAGCYYCPLSAEKAGIDVIFADELRVRRPSDILLEARLIDALGTGITGGDPLCVPRRTVKYIRMLKRRFGKGHHIHLYTAGKFKPSLLEELAKAGLDELRFHPGPETWNSLESTPVAGLIKDAKRLGISTGAEVPAIPKKERELLRLAASLDALEADFLNLNELEYSETNLGNLNSKGFRVRDDISAGALGSELTARNVVEDAKVSMTVHYCSSGYKDGIQLRRRLLRRAKNVAMPYQVITKDGTLLTGIIEASPAMALLIMGHLRREKVPVRLFSHNRAEKRVEVAPWVIGEVRGLDRHRRFIIEEYPTADGLEVERSLV